MGSLSNGIRLGGTQDSGPLETHEGGKRVPVVKRKKKKNEGGKG